MEFRRFILYFAILLSLILHLGIYLGAQFLPTQVRILPTLPVEIVYTNQKSDQSKQVVADPELGRIEKKARDQARLLSKLTRRVEREMVARNKGPSKNRPPGTTLTTGQPLPNKQKKPQKKSVDPLITSGDLALKTGQKLDLSKPQNPNQRPLGRDLVFGGSTSGEHIPFVEEGSFTSLNTDQFLYYTFFRRVNEQIRYRWVGAVREFSGRLRQSDIIRLSKIQRKTQIEVLLHPDGYLKKVLVNRSSGEKGLDQAAVVAFQKSAPLLNPPLEMKQDDGLIHLHYSFVIQWQPNYLVRKGK